MATSTTAPRHVSDAQPLAVAWTDPIVPGIIRADHLPPRIQRMVALLLSHQALICEGAAGHLELHFHDDTVKGKLLHNLAVP